MSKQLHPHLLQVQYKRSRPLPCNPNVGCPGSASLPPLPPDQQNRALEAATITLRYFTALCPTMGKTREIFVLHFLAKPGFFQANYCDVTKVEVPNCVLTCNMRNEFIAVRVYEAVKNPATTDEFATDFSFMPEYTVCTHPGVLPSKLINIHKVC